eukprot:gnl/MRDRNA2_/MRDRNA2_116069_c0_seq1.p1 gnl/MRDRNA2_/MRDRNA2_116069_c0~~gnl/MRDRNA2_/MRDRNA2_116069_c0_seq1.p1  ORF type:complete len:498 (-),score=119.49 gnl/MRDRNA2_/MRDRNA2_116069_c0_seq1:135-1628(-)
MPQQPSRRCETAPQALTDDERKMLKDIWPIELLEDPTRAPTYVRTPEAFLKEILVGDHLEDFIILPNGVELLGLEEKNCIGDDLKDKLDRSNTAYDFIKEMAQDDAALTKYKANVEYIKAGSRTQKGAKNLLPKENKDKADFRGQIAEVLRLVDEGKIDSDQLYIAELRMKVSEKHPIGGEKVKTVCRRDVKDCLGPYAPWTFYWDRYDEGVFVGGRCSGKGLHVDQVLWSNVGKNWRGYKLMASWPPGAQGLDLATDYHDVVFHPPLGKLELELLSGASKVVLVRPGDVFLFSGGVPHTVISVSECLSFTGYESIVTLHPKHVKHFMSTGVVDSDDDMFAMSPSGFDELKEDVLDQLTDATDSLEDGGPTSEANRKASPVHEVDVRWKLNLEKLHADENLQATLRVWFIEAMNVAKADAYLSRKLPLRVLEAFHKLCAPPFLEHGENDAKRRRIDTDAGKSFDSALDDKAGHDFASEVLQLCEEEQGHENSTPTPQ